MTYSVGTQGGIPTLSIALALISVLSLYIAPVSAGVCPRKVVFKADSFEDSFVNCLAYSNNNFGNNETLFQWWYNQIIGAHGSPEGHTEMWLKVNFGGRLDNLDVTKAVLKFRSGFHGTTANWDIYDTSPYWTENNITCVNSRTLMGSFQTTVSNPGIWSLTQADVTSLVVGQYSSGFLSLAWLAQTEEQEITYFSTKESLDPPILEVDTLSIPGAPSIPNALVITPSRVQLNWSEPTGHNGGAPYSAYEIYRNDGAPSASLPILALGNIDANYTNGTVTQLLGSTTYSFAIVGINGFGCSSEQGPFVNITTLAAVVPVAPAAMQFVSATGGAVTLKWTPPDDHGGSLIQSYTIYRDGAPIVTVGAGTTQFQVPGLTPSTGYNWQVLATNAVGNSPLSPVLAASTTAATVPSGPGVSMNFTLVTGGLIELEWSPPYDDGGSPVTGYELYQDGNLIYDGAGSTSTTFNVTGLSANTLYAFTVKAINGIGTSPFGPASSTTTSAATVPSHMDPPVLVSTTAGMMNISWVIPVDIGGMPVFRYRLYMEPTPTVVYDGASTNALVGGLRAGQSYTYRVSAFNVIGESALSGPATFTTSSTPTVPGAPAPPYYVYPPTDGSVPIHWAVPLDTGGVSITGYEVLLGNGTVLLTTSSNITYGVIANILSPSTAYNFTVRAINSVGTGPASEPRLTTTAAGNTPPLRPDAPTSPEQTGGRILVSWQEPVDTGNLPITAYVLYRNGGAIYTGPNREFNATGLLALTPYTFTVRAYNTLGFSPLSDPATFTTLNGTVPGPPVNLAQTAATGGTITIAWDAVLDTGGSPVTGYNVYRDAGFRDIRTVQNYQDGFTLLANSSYAYTVTALNIHGESVLSEVLTASTSAVATVPAAPLAPTFGTIGPTSVNVTWLAPQETGGSPITGYQVWIDGQLIYNQTAGAQTHYQVTANSTFQLRGATSYSFEVVAVNAVGYSQKSTAASATTLAAVVPAAPAAPTFPIVTAGMIRVAWTAVTDDGGDYITSYSLFDGGTLALLYTGMAFSLDIGNLVANTGYSYFVVANNNVGASLQGATGATSTLNPATAPTMLAPPTNAGPTGGSIAVQWQPPLDRGGAAITEYQLYRDGIPVYTGPLTTFTDQGSAGIGLTASTTYNYTVTANNGAGVSPLSIPGGLLSTAARTVPGNPAPPTAFNSTSSIITVDWLHPPETGGAPITGYLLYRAGVLIYDGSGSTQLFYVDTGLTAGTSYPYTVRALNVQGQGVLSAVGNLATVAATAPSQPSPPTFTNVMGSTMDVNWAVPSDQGGDPVTQYSLYWDAGSGGATNTLLYQGPSTTYNFASNNTYIEALTAYKFAVIATNGVGPSPKSTDATQTTGNADPPIGLVAPSVVQARGQSINLTWPYPTEDGGSVITSYTLYQDGAAIYTGSDRTHEATGLTILTTYCFRYMANNTAAGSLSPQTCQATTFGDPPDAPSPAPTVGTVTGGRIQLFWTAPANDGGRPVTAYNLYFDDGSGGVNWTMTATTPATQLNYTKYKILGSTTYQFYVTALNDNGESPPSPIRSQATLAPHVPDPVSVWIVGPATYSTVQLQWEPPLDEGGAPIRGYFMWDNRPGGSGNPANKRWDGTSHPTRTPITADQRATLDMGLIDSKIYKYRITAYNNVGSCTDISPPSNINACLNPVSHTSPTLSATTASAAGPPLSPTNAPTFSSITPVSAVVNWVAAEDDGGNYQQPCGSGGTSVACPGNIDRYLIYRDDGAGGATDILVGTTDGSTTTIPISGLTIETTYNVVIISENEFGNSTNPKPGLLTTSGPPGPPGGPVFGTVTGSSIAMTWSAPTDDGFIPNTAPAGITGYEIWWDSGTGAPLALKSTVGATTSYTDTGLSAATTYLYRIKALTTGGTSAYGNPGSQMTTPPDPPGAPGIAVASDITATSVQITWTAPTDDGGAPVTAYDLFWNNGNVNSTFPPTIIYATGNFLTYTVSPISTGPVYRFAARARTIGGPGPLGPIGDVVGSGFALRFDGTGSVSITSTLLDSLTTSTVEFWFRAPKVITNVWRTILVKDNSGLIPGLETTTYAAFVDYKGYFGVALGRGSNKGVSYLHFNQLLRDNIWYHVSFTISGSNAILYINGQSVDSVSDLTSRSFEANTPVVLGRWQNGIFQQWIGDIDELRIWNIARPASDIQSSVIGAVNPASAGLVSYHRMDENAGTQIGDATVNNIDSSNPWTGGVTWTADDR